MSTVPGTCLVSPPTLGSQTVTKHKTQCSSVWTRTSAETHAQGVSSGEHGRAERRLCTRSEPGGVFTQRQEHLVWECGSSLEG